jgi:hypothetical protein
MHWPPATEPVNIRNKADHSGLQGRNGYITAVFTENKSMKPIPGLILRWVLLIRGITWRAFDGLSGWRNGQFRNMDIFQPSLHD